MSVIAWDGQRLAADKRLSCNGAILTTTKIFKVRDCLVGYVGNADAGEELLAWFCEGADPSTFPEAQRGDECAAELLVIRPDHTITTYERTPHPITYEDAQFAIGSGRDYALAAMHLGKTARQAVEVACLFCSECGNGVDEVQGSGFRDQGSEDRA
jgi:hypothetical protein